MASTLTCRYTATVDGERIFAVCSDNGEYGISTGGMPESELRAVVEELDGVLPAKDIKVIKEALDGPPAL